MLRDRRDPENVFRWESVVLNLPGSKDYDPAKPWVYKAQKDGKIAADLHKYRDDVQETAPTQEEVDRASSVVAKIASYFGCQDAASAEEARIQSDRRCLGRCQCQSGT